MDWLNYHHLLYFWTVAKEGGVFARGGETPSGPTDVEQPDQEAGGCRGAQTV